MARKAIPELSDQVTRWVIFLSAIALIFLGAFLAIQDLVTAAAVCFVMAILLLVFVYLSRFKKFAGLGFSGELWEDKQEEAAKLIERLSGLSFAYARPVISLAAFVGRWTSGFTRRERFQLVEAVVRTMRENGASEAEIIEARAHFDRMVASDLMYPIHKAIKEYVDGVASQKRKEMEARFPQPISDIEGYNLASEELGKLEALRYPWEKSWVNFPNPDEIDRLDAVLARIQEARHPGSEQLLESLSPMKQNVEAWFKHRKLRRPEEYFSEPQD